MILYLAGPDVFLPNAREVGRTKQAICRAHGHEGLFPLDEPVPPGLSRADEAHAIFGTCVAMMERADAIVANMTPFRGISADVGTAVEVGWFAARGRPIVAYSSDPRDLATRLRDAGINDGDAVEDFGWPDNLMLPGATESSGGVWITRPAPPDEGLAAVAAFEAAVAWLSVGR